MQIPLLQQDELYKEHKKLN